MEAENADSSVVLTAAWLHDCVSVAKDSTLREKASQMAATKARTFLATLTHDETWLDSVCHAIEAHSYSAGISATTLEAKIVQDADRMDSLGAVGIARCFLVGGSLKRALHASDDVFCEARAADDTQFCIDHFYTKLLDVGRTMHTASAKIEAQQRTKFMHQYLQQLRQEIIAIE